MDVERYLLSTALSGIISQRLAKMLCPTCRYQRNTTKYEQKVFKKFMNMDVLKIWDSNPKGCEHCRRGYRGRIAIHEVLEIDDDIRSALSNDKVEKKDLAKMVYSGNTITMLQDALIKCLEGKTSFEEVYKNIEIENEDDDNYENEFVYEELLYYQDQLGINFKEAELKIKDIASFFKIEHLLGKKIYSLYICDKVLVKILALLLLSPKVFIVDNLLSYLKEDKRKLLLKYLKEKEISFINITTDAEEILFSDVVVVINNFKSVISGSPKSILEGNSILPYMGIKLPFIVDLSHNLILYNVVDKIYCDNRKLVDKLWK